MRKSFNEIDKTDFNKWRKFKFLTIWLVNYTKAEKFPFSSIVEYTNEEIAAEFNKILDKCALTVKKIEDKFISNSEELLKMKQ